MYTIYFDGGTKGNLIAIVEAYGHCSYSHKEIRALQEELTYTNNQLEYHAFIRAIEYAIEKNMGRDVEFIGDSALVVKQIKNKWKVQNRDLKPLHRKARQLLRELRFTSYDMAKKVRWVSRNNNLAGILLEKGDLD